VSSTTCSASPTESASSASSSGVVPSARLMRSRLNAGLPVVSRPSWPSVRPMSAYPQDRSGTTERPTCGAGATHRISCTPGATSGTSCPYAGPCPCTPGTPGTDAGAATASNTPPRCLRRAARLPAGSRGRARTRRQLITATTPHPDGGIRAHALQSATVTALQPLRGHAGRWDPGWRMFRASIH
jgi:hypothetical protein